MDVSHPPPSDLSFSLGALRRYWWLVLLAMVAGIGAAAGFTVTRPAVYVATASVLPAGQDTNAAGGGTQGEVNLYTEARLVRSTAVAAAAGQLLALDTPPDQLIRQVAVEVPADTMVLMIKFSADTAHDAQAGAQAFAQAYLTDREQAARAQLTAQMKAIGEKLDELNAALADLDERRSGVDLDSRRAALVNQITALTGRLNELATVTFNSGKIINDAQVPGRPSAPRASFNLAGGAVFGLVFGLCLVWLAERLGRRVRSPEDVVRRVGVPVLATVTGRRNTPLDGILPPYETGGRTVDRLRNEVLAGLPQGGQVIMVTGTTSGPAVGLIAANLGVSLSRAGIETVLVSARLPDTVGRAGAFTHLLGVVETPGLSEVLAGRVPLADVVQPAARHPRLRVLTVGAAAIADGLLQSHPLREVLAALRAQADYVVVEAPSTSASADAQSLARVTDAALLVVELGQARYAGVVDAADQLSGVGAPLLGAVVVPAWRPGRDATPAEETRPAPPVVTQTAAPDEETWEWKPEPRRGAPVGETLDRHGRGG